MTKGNQMRTNQYRLAMAVTLGLAGLAGCAHRQQAPVNAAHETRRQIARELVAQGQWEPAFAYVDALLREQADDADVLVLRATIYRERNLLSEADADLREATRLAPHLASARAGLGIVADLRRQPQEAEENLRLAVKLDARNPAYLNNLGFSLFLHGKIKEAIANYEQAARLVVETGPGPDAAPRVARDHVLERPRQIRGRRETARHVVVAEHGAADVEARVVRVGCIRREELDQRARERPRKAQVRQVGGREANARGAGNRAREHIAMSVPRHRGVGVAADDGGRRVRAGHRAADGNGLAAQPVVPVVSGLLGRASVHGAAADVADPDGQ